MHDEHSHPETAPKSADPQPMRSSITSPNHQTTRSPNKTGPSRDMIGGPWLGVIAFIVVAIGLGWGLLSLFQQGLDNARQTGQSSAFVHEFEPDAVYLLERDLMLGYLADGRIVLLPGRDDLPSGTPGRRSAVSVAEYREKPADYPEHIGVVEAGTSVRFVEVIDDRNNPQTRILVLTELLSGPYAGKVPALGMHLESADTDSGQTRYVPRADLFAILEAEGGPVQSEAESPAVE